MNGLYAAARLAVFGSIALLTACADLPHTAPQPGDAILTGRLSVRYRLAPASADESASMHFEWNAHPGVVHIHLVDPLGQSIATIDCDADHARMITRDGQRYDAQSPEALTRQALGWELPVRKLAAWLDGHAGDGRVPVAGDDGSTRLVEDGWQITYPDGSAAGAPHRLFLSYSDPDRSVEIRIVIDERGVS